MATGKQILAATVGIAVAFFVLSALMPGAITSMQGTDTTTLNTSVGETDVVSGNLEVTVDSSTAGTDSTYTLNDTEAGSTATVTVTEGTNETVTVGGYDVTITNDEAASDYSVATYEYPTGSTWGDGASSLWAILPILGLVVIVAVFAAKANGYL